MILKKPRLLKEERLILPSLEWVGALLSSWLNKVCSQHSTEHYHKCIFKCISSYLFIFLNNDRHNVVVIYYFNNCIETIIFEASMRVYSFDPHCVTSQWVLVCLYDSMPCRVVSYPYQRNIILLLFIKPTRVPRPHHRCRRWWFWLWRHRHYCVGWTVASIFRFSPSCSCWFFGWWCR